MTSAKEYDSYDGIARYLAQGLSGLNRLIACRHRAGYYRKEKMLSWVILGRWFFDSCGNCGEASKEFVPVEKFAEVGFQLPYILWTYDFNGWMKLYDRKIHPDVLTEEELTYLHGLKWDDPRKKRFKDRPYPTSYSWYMSNSIPSLMARCPICKMGWDLSNCHDVHSIYMEESLPLDQYVGMTLAQWRRRHFRHWARKRGVIARLSWEDFLQNEKYIDTSIRPDCEVLMVNEGGFVGGEGRTPVINRDTHVIEVGDKAVFNVFRFYHKACWRTHREKQEREYFEDIFKEAGFKEVTLTAIPNEYCQCEECAPWYSVSYVISTRLGASSPWSVRKIGGTIKIGWRKRVININVVHGRGKGFAWYPALDILFSDENVTKDITFIHAWGKEKCVEYLKKIEDRIANF